MTIIATDRSCGGCVGCCDGTLSFDELTQSGQRLVVGDDRSCFYMAKDEGCAGYEDRPQNCKDFLCEWMTDWGLPEFVKPSRSGFIVINKLGDPNQECYVLIQTSSYNIDQTALIWVLGWANETKKDLMISTRATGRIFFKNT